jgi:uncharacterized protein YbcV (DUF1398 family)
MSSDVNFRLKLDQLSSVALSLFENLEELVIDGPSSHLNTSNTSITKLSSMMASTTLKKLQFGQCSYWHFCVEADWKTGTIMWTVDSKSRECKWKLQPEARHYSMGEYPLMWTCE